MALVLLATCLGVFLVTLDMTIINLALPSIQRDFAVNLVNGSWVINAYTVTFASLVIVGGKLGDIFGRKRLLLVGFFTFGLGSLLGALAPDVHTLQAARVIQGVGAAMMMPGSLSVLTEAFQGRNLSFAVGLWGGIGGLGLVVGPIVSGSFTSLFSSWRAIFFFNLPIVAVAMLIAFLAVRESRDTTIDRRIDILGVVLSAGAVFLLVMAIIGGGDAGWTSAQTLGMFSGSLVLMVVFALVEINGDAPIIEPSFLRNRAFAVGTFVRFAAGFGFIPVVFMSTIYLQNFLHKSPAEAGVFFLPVGACVVITTLMWGKVVERWGPRIPMILGMTITALAALLWMTFDAESGSLALLVSLLLGSFGGTATFVTTTSVVMNSLGVDKAGVASGILNMMQNVSGALGVALVAAVFLASLKSGLASKAPRVDYQSVQAFGPEAGSLPQAEVFINAMSNAALVVTVVLLVGVAISLFLPKEIPRTPQS